MVPRTPSKSPYSFGEKLKMASWWFIEATLFRPSLHKMNGFRCFLLRLFGAKIGTNTFINAKAKIWFPWNFEIGDNSGIGFDVLIYNLGKVTMGDFVTIAHRCHIVTASHDYRKKDFPLITKSVSLKSGVFLGAETYVGPGVNIAEMAVIAARSVVISNMPAYTVCAGHPCKTIKTFEMDE